MTIKYLSLIYLLILGACSPQTGRDALFDPENEEWQKEAPDFSTIRFETSKGNFVISLHREWAPIGVDRFYNLVRLGFYDDSRFYRVRKDFIMQFGIAGKPEVAKIWEKVEINDDPVVESNRRGYISFAMTGLDTRTTQVYINLSDNIELDEQGFSPLGYVVEGMDVIDSIYSGYDENSGGGMRRGEQQKLFELGNAYLDKEFPKLDKLIDAEIIKK
ncbi:MAG: peptidylprolyl isomerase [Cyclobacteriaceae bacterium]|nr:peptidylprolyl isomerase [Cyclobacteriaceae bacterium]